MACCASVCARVNRAAACMQVDKLTKALSYSLAELHRRGFDTYIFDWKEMAFVDPANITEGAAAAPKVEPKAHAAARKRSAQSGSLLYLQNTVMDAKSAVRCI